MVDDRNLASHVGAGPDAPAVEAMGRRLLPPGSPELRELIRRRPARLFFDTGFCYAIIVLAFGALVVHPTWWVALTSFVVIGNRQYALSILTHDGDHRTLLRSLRFGDLFCEIFLCAPVGVDFEGERANHLRHHRWLASPEDPDRYLYAAEDKSTRLSFVLFLTGLTMFPRALRKALAGGPAGGPPKAPFVVRRRYLLVVQALIFGAIALVLPWWCYFVFWLGPVYPLVFVPHKIRMFCEHAQPQVPDVAADAHRLVTFLPGVIERLLFSPFNLNHHVEHHLWPFVPYYNLPRLHRLVASLPEVEVRRSYVGFVVDYFRRLPLKGA